MRPKAGGSVVRGFFAVAGTAVLVALQLVLPARGESLRMKNSIFLGSSEKDDDHPHDQADSGDSSLTVDLMRDVFSIQTVLCVEQGCQRWGMKAYPFPDVEKGFRICGKDYPRPATETQKECVHPRSDYDQQRLFAFAFKPFITDADNTLEELGGVTTVLSPAPAQGQQPQPSTPGILLYAHDYVAARHADIETGRPSRRVGDEHANATTCLAYSEGRSLLDVLSDSSQQNVKELEKIRIVMRRVVHAEECARWRWWPLDRNRVDAEMNLGRRNVWQLRPFLPVALDANGSNPLCLDTPLGEMHNVGRPGWRHLGIRRCMGSLFGEQHVGPGTPWDALRRQRFGLRPLSRELFPNVWMQEHDSPVSSSHLDDHRHHHDSSSATAVRKLKAGNEKAGNDGSVDAARQAGGEPGENAEPVALRRAGAPAAINNPGPSTSQDDTRQQEKQKSGPLRIRWLLTGIIAFLVILAAVLVLVLLMCSCSGVGSSAAPQTTPATSQDTGSLVGTVASGESLLIRGAPASAHQVSSEGRRPVGSPTGSKNKGGKIVTVPAGSTLRAPRSGDKKTKTTPGVPHAPRSGGDTSSATSSIAGGSLSKENKNRSATTKMKAPKKTKSPGDNTGKQQERPTAFEELLGAARRKSENIPSAVESADSGEATDDAGRSSRKTQLNVGSDGILSFM